MSSLNFGSTSILNLKQFSYIFLADWLVAVIATIFVIFFLDRCVGFLLSQIIGWIVWKKHRVYFSVSSVKFSLFGGRIFFKNLVYIGENEAISVLHGSYTWRYWFKRVRKNRLQYPEGDQSLPPRQLVKMTGVEWFIYNQSSAYDFDGAAVSPNSSASSETIVNAKQEYTKTELGIFKMLPISFQINTFAIICGNKSTSTLMVSFSKDASIDVDVTQPTVSPDRYKLRYNIKAVRPKMYFTANFDYDPEVAKMSKSRIAHWYSLQEIFANVKEHVRAHDENSGAPLESAIPDPAKLDKDAPTEHVNVTKLLDCDMLNVEYFYDVPGISTKEESQDPEMGYSVVFTNAAINYGPWSERRRVEFFELFFPQNCKSFTPTVSRLGSQRQISRYTTDIRFEGSSTLRIPTREFSKSLEGQTLSNAVGENANDNIEMSETPYGWLELVVAERSTVSLSMDILPQDYGFKFIVDANLIRAQMRTSVNHAELLSTDLYQFKLTQITPLEWNGLQKWEFENNLATTRIFLLREHVNLLVDLTEDLGSGKKIPYELFIPSVYKVKFNMDDIKLFVNVNPHNIISNPTSFTENLFLAFSCPTLQVSLDAPFDQVAPVSNTVTAVAKTDCLKMDIMTPSWHTLDAFLDSKTVGIAHNFELNYGITYYTEVDYSRVEGHLIDINASDFTLIAFGTIIDYLIAVIDNYGGVDFKFKTPEEFAVHEFQPPQYSFSRQGIDVDYRITSHVENSCFVFPAHLYSAKDNLCLFTESWTADLRFTNYYMDLQTEFSPVKGYMNKGMDPERVLNLYGADRGEAILSTDELVARSHRMFGLPPSEPTYVCKWDFNIGDLVMKMPAGFVSMFPQIGQSFAHGFANSENEPFFEVFKPVDVTFVSAIIGSISLELDVDGDSINVNTSMITAKFHDLANKRYSDKIFLDIPSINVSGSNNSGRIFELSTSCRSTVFTVKGNHEEHYEQQQDHIMLHDSLFHRCPFLLDDKHRKDPIYASTRAGEQAHITPAIATPMIPPQLTRETLLIIDSDMGVFNYKGKTKDASDSDTGSETSLYGSGIYSHNTTSSSDISSDDGSVIVKRNVKANMASPENSKYFSPHGWEIPQNDAKNIKSQPVFPLNAPDDQNSFHTAKKSDEINLISEIGPIRGSLHTDFIQVVQNMMDIIDDVNMEAVLDKLEAKLVAELKQNIFKDGLNVFVQVPSVNISIEGEQSFAWRNDGSSTFLELSTIQVLGGVKPENDVLNPTSSTRFRTSVDRIIAGIRTEGIDASRIDLANQELIFTANDSSSDVEWKAGTIDFTTKADQVEDLAQVVKGLLPSSSPPKEKLLRKPIDPAALIYSILVAGQKAGIEHDPYVLSRTPAVQIKNNIRGDISWRIIMRLRYLFNNISALDVGEPPKDSRKQVLEILENWRSWERIEPLHQSRILSEFKESSGMPQYFPKIHVSVESFSTVLKYNDTQEDYLVLDEFEVHGSFKKPSDNWTKFLIGITAQRARLGATWNIIDVIRIIEGIQLSRDPHEIPDQPSKESQESTDQIFQGVISLNVCDWSADLKAKSLKAELQNKNLQLITTIDYREGPDTLFAHGVFSNTQSAIRAYSPQKELEIVDYLMEGVNIGFSTDTTHLKGPLWLSVDVEYLNLAFNATFEQTCHLAQLVLEQEYAEASALQAEFSHKDSTQPVSLPTTSSKERVLNLLMNANLKISEIVFKVQAMSDFDFVFSGTDFALSGRMPEENALLLNIEWSGYVLRVMSEQNQCLGSFLVSGTHILARADLEALAFDIKYKVESVNLETSSVLLVLRYMEKPQVVERAKDVQRAVNDTIQKIKLHTGQGTVEPVVKETKNSLWNYTFNISQVRISLPVDTFSFLFIFDEIGAESRAFEWVNSGAKGSDTSLTHVSTSEFSVQLLEGGRSTKLLSVQLLGSYHEVPNLSSIFFSSEFCRLSLGPSSVAAICIAFEKVKTNVMHLLPESSGDKDRKKDSSSSILDVFSGIKAAISLREFSITWLTEQAGTLSEGVVAGFELLQINLVSHQCRMDLIGLAITPKNSPWKSLDVNKYENYALLPHVEIVGVLLKEEKYIDIRINGESLHVNMRPSVGMLVSAIITSVGKCRDLLESNTTHAGNPRSPDSITSPETMIPKLKATIDERKSGLMDYSLGLQTSFDAASFKLWDDTLSDNMAEAGSISPEPSIELHSPDMVTIIEYLHKENERDTAFVNVHVSKSSNEIYPKALQELKALFNYSTTAYGTIPTQKQPQLTVPTNNTITDTANSFETVKSEIVARLLRSLDVTIKVNLEEQRLSVSCQPFSKITATVSTDAMELLATTPIRHEDVYLSLAGKIQGAQLMLQHAHSHGHSGFGSISEVSLSIIHKISDHANDERILVGVNIDKPEFELRAAQIKDIELFIDIWNPKRDMSDIIQVEPKLEVEPQVEPPKDALSIGKRYKQLLAEFPMGWSVDITIADVICHADLGSSLGKVKINIDRAWSSLHRSGNIQQLVSGLDNIDLKCEGRVSGDVKIKGISKHLTVYWNDIKNVPLIQFSLDMKALDLLVDIDGHRFLAGQATRWRGGFANNLNKITSGVHELFASAELDNISIALTSLVASNIYDVIEPLNFLRSQTAIYQKSLDRENDTNKQESNRLVSTILARLRVQLSGQVNRVAVYVFPTNFEDTTALKVRANLIKFKFDRKVIIQDILPSYLEVESYGIKVGLVGGAKTSSNSNDLFQKLQSRTVSSMLVNIPHASVSMDTTDIEGKRVEYIFKSAFHGDLEVGWNLGTINFIRELYETHERTWLSRVAIKERAALETNKRRPQTIKEYMEQIRPEYVPTSTPEINIPNIHDMGHATPPVEWVGFNRERLPGMTHWFAIRALNKVIGDIEQHYGKLLY